jgi:hypothetical protein
MKIMRGADTFTESLFSMRKLDDFIPPSHPLRAIRVMANEALAKMDLLFAGMYEADIKGGRPSIAPEKLLREAYDRRAAQLRGRASGHGRYRCLRRTFHRYVATHRTKCPRPVTV